MISDIEELINTLNPNTIQCEKCKKWFLKGIELDYKYIKIFNICIECFDDIDNEQ